MVSLAVELVKNQNRKERKVVVLKSADRFKELCTAAKNKLKVNMKRAFRITGEELSAEDIQSWEEHSPGTQCVVVVSAGEDFCFGSGGKKSAEPSTEKSLCGSPGAVVTVIAKNTPIEEDAVKQLEQTARNLRGVRMAVGLPDLHPGPSYPIGTAVVTDGWVYPHLVGGDIGCGMLLTKTSLRADSADKERTVERWVKNMDIDGPWEGDAAALLAEHGVEAMSNYDQTSLGTIGAGNHFAELQSLETIVDAAACEELGISPDRLYLLVHSGSRGLGSSVLEQHMTTHGPVGLTPEMEGFQDYMARHDHACQWARVNRKLIARRFMEHLGTEGSEVLDIWHNNVVKRDFATIGCEAGRTYLHRKGAAPGDVGAAVIPGSRGSRSYVVMPTTDTSEAEKAAYSLAHGAGRSQGRTKAREQNQRRYSARELEKTAVGSRVVCNDPNLIFEEAPSAYKDVDGVVQDLVDLKLCRIVAVFLPILSYKTARKVT